MSSTELFGFDRSGDAYFLGETQNSWRGAMAIWGILEEKYLPSYIPDFIKACNWYQPDMSFEEVARRNGYKPSRITSLIEEKGMKEIWDLADSDKVSMTDKIVLFTTFDKCLVKKQDLPRAIEAFRAFEGETSLKEQADILEQAFGYEDCIAIGWNQTSINGDSWDCMGPCDEEGNGTPYNCLTQNEHYWLFDELSAGRNI